MALIPLLDLGLNMAYSWLDLHKKRIYDHGIQNFIKNTKNILIHGAKTKLCLPFFNVC